MALISDYTAAGSGTVTAFDITSRRVPDNNGYVLTITEQREWVGLTEDAAKTLAASYADNTSSGGAFSGPTALGTQTCLAFSKTAQFQVREDQRVVGSYVVAASAEIIVEIYATGGYVASNKASGHYASYPFTATLTPPAAADADDQTFVYRYDLYGMDTNPSLNYWTGTGTHNISITEPCVLFSYCSIDGIVGVESSNIKVYC